MSLLEDGGEGEGTIDVRTAVDNPDVVSSCEKVADEWVATIVQALEKEAQKTPVGNVSLCSCLILITSFGSIFSNF